MVKKICLFLFVSVVPILANIQSDLQNITSMYSNRQYQEALEAVDAVLKKNPYFRQALFLKANILYELNETKEAEKIWLKVYKIDPSFQPVLFRLAQYYVEIKKYKKAQNFYTSILKIEPLNIYAKLGLSHIYIETMQFNSAKEILQEIQRLKPTAPDVYYQMGLLALKQNKYNEAERYFMRAKNLDSSFGKAYTQLGKIMLYKNDKKAAEYFLNEAVRLDKKKLQNYSALAQLYILTKEWKKVEKLYSNVQNKFNNNSLFFYNFAVIEEVLKNYNEWMKKIEKALTIDSEEPFAKLYYFFTLKDNMQFKKKSQTLSKSYFSIAKSYYDNGNFSKAIQFYRRALMLYPESSTNRYYFAMCFKRLGLIKRYLKELKIVLSLNDSVDKWNFQYERDKRKFRFAMKGKEKINPTKTPTKILIFPFSANTLNTYHLNAGKLLGRELQMYLNNNPHIECTFYNGDLKNKYDKIQDYDFFVDGNFIEQDNYLSIKASLISTYDRKIIKSFSHSSRNNKRISVTLGNLSHNLLKTIPFKGEIFKQDKNQLYINLGAQDKIKKSSHLVLYSPSSHPFQVTKENKIDDLKILSVYDDFLIAVPKHKKLLNKIHLYQKVILIEDKKNNDSNKQ